MFENYKRIFRSSTVPHIRVEGIDQVTLIEYIGEIEKDTNTIKNLFDLLGYEIQSNTIEIFSDKKYLGRGYVADIAGITVDIKRVVPEDPKPEIPNVPAPVPPGMLDITEGLSIIGSAINGAIKPDFKNKKGESVPCVILAGSTRVDLLRFQYLREIPSAIIDDEGNVRYNIKEGTRIDITMPDGKTNRGYVCDPSGYTIKIKREIKILSGPEEKPVEVKINFSGRIGKQATSDKLTKLLAMASGRENLILLAFVALVANIIGVVVHI